jgi:lipoprotein-anchoring transpeptidase ErfK/SrfK
MGHAAKFATLLAMTVLALTGRTVPSAASGDMVAFRANVAPGTIVVRTGERRLYLILADGYALRYVVGVGRARSQWAGSAVIDGKYLRPNWAPPDLIKRENPALPDVIAGGSPGNPMGAAAMTLSGGQYAIHGTNTPKSIGGFVSHGCIRMYNQDISDLFHRVRIGTPVVVTR